MMVMLVVVFVSDVCELDCGGTVALATIGLDDEDTVVFVVATGVLLGRRLTGVLSRAELRLV